MHLRPDLAYLSVPDETTLYKWIFGITNQSLYECIFRLVHILIFSKMLIRKQMH